MVLLFQRKPLKRQTLLHRRNKQHPHRRLVLLRLPRILPSPLRSQQPNRKRRKKRRTKRSLKTNRRRNPRPRRRPMKIPSPSLRTTMASRKDSVWSCSGKLKLLKDGPKLMRRLWQHGVKMTCEVPFVVFLGTSILERPNCLTRYVLVLFFF